MESRLNLIERMMQKWIRVLNACFDFGSKGVTKKGAKSALLILLLIVTVLALLLICLIATGPEQLPGT